MSTLIEARLRIRDAADTTDVLVVSSVRGGTNPYLVEWPNCDGSEFDPNSGAYRSGSATFRIADAITSGTDRVFTSKLEDSSYRQQLAGRPAYGEYRVNGGSWASLQAGIITGIRLSSPAVWDVDVGDATRATRNLLAFAPRRNTSDPTQVEPLATYLARWPIRGCIAGGPVIGTFLSVQDKGGWEMKVSQSITAGAKKIKFLEFVSGYAPPGFGRSTTASGPVADSLNSVLGPRTGPPIPTSFPNDLEPSSWPDVVVQVGTGYYSPASPYDAAIALGISSSIFAKLLKQASFMGTENTAGFYVWDSANVLTVGSTIVRVRVFDAIPSERSPIYGTYTPTGWWQALCDESNLTYDSSAVSTVAQALGLDRVLSLRITGPQAWSSFVEGTLYGPCGFSVRTNASGQLQPFTTRLLTATAPTRTITSADVPTEGGVLFDLSEPDAITKLTVSQQNLIPTDETFGDPGTGPTDGVQVQSVSVIRTSGDAGGTVDREQTYTIPGMLHTGDTRSYSPTLVDAIAREVFDRQGRGRLSGEVSLLRGLAGDGVLLGEEMIVNLPAMPNHNKRLGDDNSVAGRVVQVVRLTPSARGMMAKFLDSGASNQTVPTVPTLSIAVGSAATLVDVTITNAATLNAADYGARLQWATTTGGSPTTGQYADVGAWEPGKIPTTAITLPAVVPGRKVYAQARSEKPGTRPSNYGTAVSQSLTAFGAPSSLTATPSGTDGSLCALAWTTGTNAAECFVRVFVRLSADPASNNVQRARLLPGSVAYTLDGLTPSSSYTASVQHEDTHNQVSSLTTVTFTAGATTVTLGAPTNPAGVVGSTSAQGITVIDGTYGLDVFATVLPGFVEFAEAVETGVGAGAYGSFVAVAKVPSVSGNVTSYRAIAPNDKLRRQLKARHVQDGATSSGYTSAVTLSPWGAVQGPNVSGGYALSAPVATAVYGTPGTLTVTFSNSGFPSGTTFDLAWSVDGGAAGTSSAITSGAVISTNLSSGASGKVELSANYAGMILAQKKYWGVFPT